MLRRPGGREDAMNLSFDRLRELAGGDDELVAALAAEVLRLQEAIRAHQSNTGHALCWLNDLSLWRTLQPDAEYPHETLPVREEFLAQCARFYESRLTGTPYEEPQPKRTIERHSGL
jgi:hypothetical protein